MGVLGIDLGSNTIKIVQAKAGKKLSITNSYLLHTPQGAIIDGEIKDMLMVVSAIKTFMNEHHIKAKEVSFSLQSPNVNTRELKLPAFSKSEVMPALEFELSQIFPGIVQSHTLTYQQISKAGEPIVGLSAFCPTAMLIGYVELANLLGLTIRTIDVSANAIAKSLRLFGDASYMTENMLLVDIGTAGSQVTVLSKGRMMLSRYVSTGVSALDQIVATRCGVTIEQAEAARMMNDYDKLGLSNEDLDFIARLGYSAIEDQIRQTMDFFTSNKGNEAITKILIMGGGCHFPGLATHFETLYRLPVHIAKLDKMALKQPSELMLSAAGCLIVDSNLTQDFQLIPGLQMLQKYQAQTNRTAILLGTGVVIALLGLSVFAFAYFGVQSQNDRALALEQEAATYKPATELKQQIIVAQDTADKIKAIIALSDKTNLINSALLTDIGKAMPENVFIMSYAADGTSTISFTGIALDRPSIALFVRQLTDLESVTSATLQNVTRRAGPDGNVMDYSFTLQLQLKGR